MTIPLRAWITLGRQNTRKGSTIRSPTGLGQSKWCEVALVNGQRLRLWGQITSADEGNHSASCMPSLCRMQLPAEAVNAPPHWNRLASRTGFEPVLPT